MRNKYTQQIVVTETQKVRQTLVIVFMAVLVLIAALFGG